MSGCHELLAGVEHQAIILDRPDLHAVKQPPRLDEHLHSVSRRRIISLSAAHLGGLGPTIHSSRDPTSRIVARNP
jgi:hypothetical protein